VIIFLLWEKWKKKTILKKNIIIIIQTPNLISLKVRSRIRILSVLYIAIFTGKMVSPSPLLIVLKTPSSKSAVLSKL